MVIHRIETSDNVSSLRRHALERSGFRIGLCFIKHLLHLQPICLRPS
jgi:hypothetical protein